MGKLNLSFDIVKVIGQCDKVHYGLCESINKLNEVLSFVMEK